MPEQYITPVMVQVQVAFAEQSMYPTIVGVDNEGHIWRWQQHKSGEMGDGHWVWLKSVTPREGMRY